MHWHPEVIARHRYASPGTYTANVHLRLRRKIVGQRTAGVTVEDSFKLSVARIVPKTPELNGAVADFQERRNLRSRVDDILLPLEGPRGPKGGGLLILG